MSLRGRVLLPLLLPLLLALQPEPTLALVRPALIYVNSSADSGPGTLRDAIWLSNINPAREQVFIAYFRFRECPTN